MPRNPQKGLAATDVPGRMSPLTENRTYRRLFGVVFGRVYRVETAHCPHCGAENAQGTYYCTTCGKALATPHGAAGPRIVEADGLAGTAVGQSLQTEELHKQARKAAGALLAVAILQWVFGAILIAIAESEEELRNMEVRVVVYAVVFIIGAIFFALCLWARKNPLPAAITGLVLFVSIHLLDAAVDPTSLVRGIIVKIIIVVVLARAISAGIRYRKLREQAQPF